MDFLQELGEGEVLRRIVCDVIVQECLDVGTSSQELRRADSEQSSSSSFQFLSASWSNDSVSDCCERESTSYLDLLLDLIIKLDFPEKLVTFLLQLLPDQEYKVLFTTSMCVDTNRQGSNTKRFFKKFYSFNSQNKAISFH